MRAAPESRIGKSLFVASSHQGGEESSPRNSLGIMLTGWAGAGNQGSQRVQPEVLRRCGVCQTCGNAEIPRSRPVRGKVGDGSGEIK